MGIYVYIKKIVTKNNMLFIYVKINYVWKSHVVKNILLKNIRYESKSIQYI